MLPKAVSASNPIMEPASHPHDPERKGAGPVLLVAILAVVIAAMAAFLYFRPKPQGAVDSQRSPAAAPKAAPVTPK